MKKHKYTWIDGLIIAVILLLVVGTCVKFFVNDTTSVTQERVDFTYQLQIAGIRQVSVDALEIGDTVYGADGKGAVGVISDIQVEPYTATYGTPSGELKEANVEDRYIVTLTLDAEGIINDGEYKVDTYTIQVNDYATYFTKYSIWSATTLAIN